MALLSLAVRKGLRHSDGTYSIYVAVTHNGRVRYLTTRYRIDSLSEWRNGKVVANDSAQFINMKLRRLLMRYDDIIDQMPNIRNLTATELCEYLRQHEKESTSLAEYAERYLEYIKANRSASYYQNMQHTVRAAIDALGKNMALEQMSRGQICRFEEYLRNKGQSDTTINIRMSHLKAMLNKAIADGVVSYDLHPFFMYSIPQKAIRDLCLSKQEITALRDADLSSSRRLQTAKDLFLLSFYCAGINLTDLVDARFDGNDLTFIRKKTSERRNGNKEVSMSIQQEARAIIDRYITQSGKLDFGYNYSDYGQFRSYITKTLNRIGEMLGFEKRLMFYSARKTFCQFGFEIGIPIYILEYAIGHTIKDANHRPVFNYIKVMRKHTDPAIRSIIDYAFSE